MNAVQTWQFEDSAIDQAITALVMAPVQFAIGAGWVAWQAVKFAAIAFVWLFAAIYESRQQVAMLAGLIAATVVLVTQPQIAVGIVLIVAYAVSSKRLYNKRSQRYLTILYAQR